MRTVTAKFRCQANKAPLVRGSWKRLREDGQALASAPLVGVSPPQNVLIVDLDEYKGVSTDDVDRAVGIPIPWSEAFLQRTPSGGSHYAFIVPHGMIQKIRNSKNVGIDGLDTRCPNKGYICTGNGYEPNALYRDAIHALETADFPQIPSALFRFLSTKPNTTATRRFTHGNNSITAHTARIGRTTRIALYTRVRERVTIPRRCIPTQHGERNAKLLLLARWLHGVRPDASEATIREIVARWYRLASPHMRTQSFQTSLREFTSAYKAVETPPMALERALHGFESDELPARLQAVLDPVNAKLARACLRLQAFWGTKPFFLGCRKAGELLGLSHTAASRRLKALVDAGVLRLTMKGKYSSKYDELLATEYLFVSETVNPPVETTGSGAETVKDWDYGWEGGRFVAIGDG